VLTPINVPLATDTLAFGINDGGDIVGRYIDTAREIHGFIYAGGAFSTIDVFGAVSCVLTGIANDGAVAGTYVDFVGGLHGLIGH